MKLAHELFEHYFMKPTHVHQRFWIVIGLLLAGLGRSSSYPIKPWLFTFSNKPPRRLFLYPPYFGTVSVISIFDHEFPRYDSEAALGGVITDMVHYNGTRLIDQNYSKNSADLFYSGHPGIDYDVSFSRVLAAAS